MIRTWRVKYSMIFWEDTMDLLDIFFGNTFQYKPPIVGLIICNSRFGRVIQRYWWFRERILQSYSAEIQRTNPSSYSKTTIMNFPIFSKCSKHQWAIFFHFEMTWHHFSKSNILISSQSNEHLTNLLKF